MARFALVLSGLLIAACACQLASDEPRIQLTSDSISHISLGGPVSSSPVAVSPDGRLVAAVNPDSDSITLIDTTSLSVLSEIPVGDDPRTLSFTPDSKQVVVANYGSDTISKCEGLNPNAK